MLFTIDGKQITRVPHRKDFHAVLEMLRENVLRRFERVWLGSSTNANPMRSGTRTFSSSFLGSELSPWPYPLKHLYDISWEMEGDSAPDEIVEARAGLIFGFSRRLPSSLIGYAAIPISGRARTTRTNSLVCHARRGRRV